MADIVELTDLNYESFLETTESIVFIDFYSEMCWPCQTLLKYLPRMAEYYKHENIVIAKINVTLNPKAKKKYNLRTVPMTIIIGKDKMVKRSVTGLHGRRYYCKMIDHALREKKGFIRNLFGVFKLCNPFFWFGLLKR
jgi:thioredoxin-like negative regulator of GroEL